MRWSVILLVCGLLLGEQQARAQDIAARPAYPIDEPSAPAKAKTKPARKPIAAKPAPVAKPAERKAATAPEPKKDPAPAKPATLAATLAAPTALGADPLAAVPLAERAAIRDALLWSGADNPGSGEDATAAAIAAYRKRNKSKNIGPLTAGERAELAAAAKAHADQFGWSVVVDPATGIRIGLPSKFMPSAREAKNGTRWSSAHGEIAVETFRIRTSDSLSALFESQKKEPANRKIESSYIRPDSFFVTGLQGLKQFAVRAQLKNGELRGYTMFYDQAMAGIVLPVLPPMANAFAAFPNAAAPFAALGQPVNYGSGLVVSAAGDIVTDRAFAEGCDVIAVPEIGNAERVAVDAAHGLALLRVYGKRNLTPAALATDAAGGSELRLIGVPDPQTQNGGNKLSEIKAQLSDGDVVRLRDSMPVAGLSGATALDGRDRVLGMIKMRDANAGPVLAGAGAAAPPVRMVPAAAIRGFLAANNIAATDDGGSAKASIVRVICVRK